MRIASGHQGEIERQWKKNKKQNKTKQKNKKRVNKNTYNISFIKRVTWKFLEVSRCSRAKKNGKDWNVQKKCAARAKLFFC